MTNENLFQKLIDSTKKDFQGKHWTAYKALVDSDEKIYKNFPKLEATGEIPNLIVCTAYVGSGKTTFSGKLVERGYKVVESDRVRDEVLGGILNPPEQEAKVTKAMVELRDHFLLHGYDTIIAACSVNNFYRELFLSTNVPVNNKMLLFLKTDRKIIEERRGKRGYELIDMLWEDPDPNAPFMQDVKYFEISSNNREDINENIERVLKELE